MAQIGMTRSLKSRGSAQAKHEICPCRARPLYECGCLNRWEDGVAHHLPIRMARYVLYAPPLRVRKNSAHNPHAALTRA